MGLFDFFKSNKGINSKKFNSEDFQKEILGKAEGWYMESRDYESVAAKLKKSGLNEAQAKKITEKLKKLNQERVESLEKELDSGRLKIKVEPVENDGTNPTQSTKDAVDANIGFGAFQMDKGAFDNALELFDKAIELDDKATLAYANKGTLYSRKGDYHKALFFYNKALEIEPNHQEILTNKASLLQDMGRIDEAMVAFKTILKNHPNNPKSLNGIGIIYAQRNELKSALSCFDKLLAMQPDDQEALCNKLNVLCLLDLGKAQSFHKRNFARIRDESFHHLVPSKLYEKGREAQAGRHYDELYKLTGDDKWIKLKGHFYYAKDPKKAIALYDRFLKRNPNDEDVKKFRGQLVGSAGSEALSNFLFKYREYVVKFVTMQMSGNFAPIGAFEKMDGSVEGFLYVVGDEGAEFSMEEAVVRMWKEFEKRILNKSIKSYTIYYHSQLDGRGNYVVAYDDLKAISIQYKSSDGLEGVTRIPYDSRDGQYHFQLIEGLTQAQHHRIWATQLEPHKNYFQNYEKITSAVENEAGIKVKEKYEGKVGSMWEGIFGIDRHAEIMGSMEYAALLATALFSGTKKKNGDITVTEYQEKGMLMRVVSKGKKEDVITLVPVVKTAKSIPVENKVIHEWAHVDHVEARIKANGRDTFAFAYYATDYTLNRERYLSNKNLNVRISGIAYMLDRYKPNPNNAKTAPDFCMYFPYEGKSEDCFNFVGVLKGFKETEMGLLGVEGVGGYIFTVKLINHPEIEDFFTIDMFVGKHHMKFGRLEIGMQLTGLVLLQGEIDDSSNG